MSTSIADCSPPSNVFSPSDLRSLRSLCERMAAELGEALPALTRAAVEVRPTGIEQLFYGKFVAGLAVPTCFSVLNVAPLGECFFLDVELSILYPMLDRLLGGGEEGGYAPQRPLSDIELPLASRLIRAFLEPLRHAWRDIADLEIEPPRIESNPRLSRTLPSDERIALIGFQLRLGGRQGMLRLGLPCRVIQRLDAERRADARPAISPENAMPPDALVEVSVTVATTPILAGELADLRVGDVLVTETAADAPLTVSLAGQPKFLAAAGAHRGRKAVRITGESPDAGGH